MSGEEDASSVTCVSATAPSTSATAAAAGGGSGVVGAVFTMKKCTRNKCGKEYGDDANLPNSCCYHPGVPVFHEGLKGWTCCDKRFTDFSEFLDYPGCTLGMHTDEPSPATSSSTAATTEMGPAAKAFAAPETEVDRKPLDTNTRTPSNGPKTSVPVKVSTSLERALQKQAEATRKAAAEDVIKVGDRCVNKACNATYTGNPDVDAAAQDACCYHTGGPVFHDGRQYWSCCPKKKHYDFDEFLAAPGCTRGAHRWRKSAEEMAEAKKCRVDHFQTAETVTISIFAKCIDPSTLTVSCNADTLSANFIFEGSSRCDLDLLLLRDIDPAQAKAEAKSMKLDIKLVKKDAADWPSLTPSL